MRYIPVRLKIQFGFIPDNFIYGVRLNVIPKEDSARIEADNINQDQYLKQKR